MKTELIFLLVGYLMSLLQKRNYKWDCICGELLGIVYLVIIAYLVYGRFGLIWLEPWRVGRIMILGYLPGRVLSWL